MSVPLVWAAVAPMLIPLLLLHTGLVKAIVHHVLAMVIDIKHDANPRSGGGARPP